MWTDITHWWDALGDWLTAHEQDADLWSVWLIVIGCTVLALVKLATWITIRNQRDRTDAGRALKRQKAAETAMFTAFATLYGLSLIAYYTGAIPVNIWGRTTIRGVVVGGTIIAALAGIRLVRALRALDYGQPDQEVT